MTPLRRPRTILPWIAPFFAACAIGSSNTYPETAPARAAVDLPPEFAQKDSVPAASAAEPGSCPSPLLDPRDGTRLLLRSSQGGRVGDYEVPGERYGVRPNEYLRVDCRTRRPLGAVPRPG